MEKIKLVIWDMDDTFWNGNLKEDTMKVNQDNVDLVRILVDRGIMNSISSKNEYSDVEAVLRELKIWDYFIFPSINYLGKGQQVREIISKCKLRPENVLFLDDNEINIQEVKFYNQGIQTLSNVSDIKTMMDNPAFVGKDDAKHERLQQYHILEKKEKDIQKFEDNDAFLMDSNIKVDILYNAIDEVDRIHELIERTNQLNFTKLRICKEDTKLLLESKKHKCGFVRVHDKYGDYGIVGFFSVNCHDELEHFLFSCRTLGLGVEKYVYEKIGRPKLLVNGNVSIDIFNEKYPYWINNNIQNDNNDINIKMNNDRIVVRGGCDLSQLQIYLDTVFPNIEYEFNHLSFHRDHSYLLSGCRKYSNEEKELILSECPFLGDNTFDTNIFDEDVKVVVYSVLMDYVQAVYHKKGTNLYVAYGDYDNPSSIDKTFTSDYEAKTFHDKYEFVGRTSDNEFLSNLSYIRKNLSPNVMLLILNGSEVDSTNELERKNNRKSIHKHMNELLDKFVANNDNTFLIDVRKYVRSSKDLNDNIRHYQRNVYYKIAMEMIDRLSTSFNVSTDDTNTKLKLRFGFLKVAGKEFVKKIREKMWKKCKHLTRQCI